MGYPAFFDRIEPLRLHDPLAEILGSFVDGIVEIHYLDVVRLAGHSCPTVAGAYLMAKKGLEALYGEKTMPERGDIAVEMQQGIGEGVTGVVANVLSYITGATDQGGFHGLAGRFDRRNLLTFGHAGTASVSLIRRDTGRRLSMTYDPSVVPVDPTMERLFPRVLAGKADADEALRFGILWQRRVEAILCEYADDPWLLVLQAEQM